MNSKKNTYKKLLLILIIIIIITGIIIYINKSTSTKTNTNNKKENTTIYNTAEGIVSSKNINEILFTDINCKIKNKQTQLEYIITNNTDAAITLNNYKLIFKDKNNKEIGVINANLSTELASKTSINIDNYTTLNLKDAVNLEIELTE